MKVTVRIAGEAGQGLVTAGNLLVKILTAYNLYVFTNQSYMSRIRGGLNWYDITISDEKIFSPTEISDFLIALNEVSLSVLKENNKLEENIFLNSDKISSSEFGKVNLIDFVKEAGNKILISTYSVGLIIGRLNLDEKIFNKKLKEIYNSEKDELSKKNVSAAENGFKKGKSLADNIKFEKNSNTPSYIITGAKAIGLSAAISGIKLVSSYPMTPGTATFMHLAQLSNKYKIVVEQAEDEISAINMICGASYAGAPAMTCTSGGGFSLMCEGISLSGMHEVPILILVAQRPGPATGLPTRTGQEDLKFAINSGHGDFPKAVYAPGTIEECYTLTRKALETAHKYQIPVILLTDQYLQDHIENIEPLNDEYSPLDRYIEENPNKYYKRYNTATINGVSPRAVPGGNAIVVSDSDEHDDEGHLTEDLNIRIAQQNKRMGKISKMLEDTIDPTMHGSNDAKKLLICWGSTYGACRDAVDFLNKNGIKSDMLHFSQVWPINKSKVHSVLKNYDNVYVIEGNCTGQFGQILKENGIISEYSLISRYDGLPITSEYIIEGLK